MIYLAKKISFFHFLKILASGFLVVVFPKLDQLPLDRHDCRILQNDTSIYHAYHQGHSVDWFYLNPSNRKNTYMPVIVLGVQEISCLLQLLDMPNNTIHI